MVLTKREKILLQILLVIGLLSLILALLVLPVLTKTTKFREQLVDTEMRLEQAEEIVANEELDKIVKREQAIAEGYYEFFYSALNGYTIDGIFNSLIQKNGLYVNRLHIGNYEPADFDFAPVGSDVEGEATSTKDETENILVKSVVDVQMLGNTENILSLIDDLNEQSVCLRVGSINIYPNTNAAFVEQSQTCDLKVYVYGINTGQQDLNLQVTKSE